MSYVELVDKFIIGHPELFLDDDAMARKVGISHFAYWLDTERGLTTDAPEMTVGDSSPINEDSTDEREACPDDRHTYYEMMLDYQFCPYCAKRLHWMGPTNNSFLTPSPTPSFR